MLLTLRPQTYGPEGYVVREGEPGREIFFISRGELEITSEGGARSHGTLGDGEYFGDLSMLLAEKRTASVKALTYCEVFILAGEDFTRIKDEYPEFKEVLQKVSAERTERKSELLMDGVVL